jgi:hypothetical protein
VILGSRVQGLRGVILGSRVQGLRGVILGFHNRLFGQQMLLATIGTVDIRNNVRYCMFVVE